MKTLSYRATEDFTRTGSLSPKSGRVRKSSQERKERKSIEEKLRRLVGHSENDQNDQLELILSAIERIRNLQQQLQDDKENGVPAQLTEMFENVSTNEKK
ncbi:unnamed protein product, partial [Mesorhabditis belari]|uniref:BHLH domain-containing protein n=1 Tax=Mesorhabditis belari TaxID=2138241 RepID=A0AAF3J9D6_9BILA